MENRCFGKSRGLGCSHCTGKHESSRGRVGNGGFLHWQRWLASNRSLVQRLRAWLCAGDGPWAA